MRGSHPIGWSNGVVGRRAMSNVEVRFKPNSKTSGDTSERFDEVGAGPRREGAEVKDTGSILVRSPLQKHSKSILTCLDDYPSNRLSSVIDCDETRGERVTGGKGDWDSVKNVGGSIGVPKDDRERQ